MRILVCGGREFAFVADHKTYVDSPSVRRAQAEYTFLRATLDRLVHVSDDTVLHGGARGADTAAGMWAEYHQVPVEVYKADWVGEGKAAGIKRNLRMLTEGKPDLVIAFPGGRGTDHMVRVSKAAGVEVIEVAYAPEV